MQDQNNNNEHDSLEFDDDNYDDVLDEGFEDELSDSDLLELEEDEDFDYLEDSLSEDDEEFSEWDDDDGQSDYAEMGAGAVAKDKKPRFRMSFNAMAITGALVVGVFVLGYKVMSSKPQGAIDTFISSLRMGGASDGSIFGEKEVQSTEIEIAPQDQGQTVSEGFLDNPDLLDSMEDNLNNKEDENIETTEVKSEAVQLPRPPEDDFAAEFFQEEPIQETLPEKTMEPVIEEEKIDTDSVKIEQEQPIVAAVNTLETTPSVPSPVSVVPEESAVALQPEFSSEGIDTALSEKLDMIVNRLDNMEKQITQIQASGDLRVTDLKEDLSRVKQVVEKIEMQPKPSVSQIDQSVPVKKVITPKKQQAKKLKQKPKASVSKKIVWELRAAQPGKAWISKKGAQQLKPIVVGDQVSGIGRIISIDYDGRRWTVRGTSGRILQ